MWTLMVKCWCIVFVGGYVKIHDISSVQHLILQAINSIRSWCRLNIKKATLTFSIADWDYKLVYLLVCLQVYITVFMQIFVCRTVERLPCLCVQVWTRCESILKLVLHEDQKPPAILYLGALLAAEDTLHDSQAQQLCRGLYEIKAFSLRSNRCKINTATMLDI